MHVIMLCFVRIWSLGWTNGLAHLVPGHTCYPQVAEYFTEVSMDFVLHNVILKVRVCSV